MSYESPFTAYDQLSPSVKDGMIDVIKTIIDEENLQQINSSEFGNRILHLDSSKDFKRHCGTHSRQCFGILLRDYLAGQPNWSDPKTVDIKGQERKIYSRDSG
tara:strand:+ start:1740 stop:2048 length:309 start_codon:yes stop_codon:yes gene_type:complete